MNPMFQKIIDKKKAEGKSMSPVHKEAKGSVLSDLMDHLEGMGMDKVKGMKKVSVASDSKEGLKTGLDKAKELVSGHESDDSQVDDEMEESPEHEASESPEEESSEHEEKSPEELQAEIEELKARLEQLTSMKA